MSGDDRDPREEIWDQCRALADYLKRLEDLTIQPRAPHGGPARPHRPALIPEPYGPAGRLLMDIHQGVRWLEAQLLLAVTGRYPRARGGSTANTFDAVTMIGKAASQLTDRDARWATRTLARWINAAQTIPGIDEARRWRHLPRQDGEALPPQCPYCLGYYLLADVEAQIVVCSKPRCADGNGDPPVASMGIDESRRGILTWADGLIQAAPRLDATATA